MRFVLSSWIVLAVGLSHPAFAQSNQTNPYGGGSRLQPRAAQIVQSGQKAAEIVLQNFGECLVERRTASIMQLLDMSLATPDYEKGFQRIFADLGDSCLEGDGTLQFSNSLLRGSLFQALYRKNFSGKAVVDFPLDFATDFDSKYVRPWSDAVRQHIVLQQFSECLTKADSAAVTQLVLSSAGSVSEEGAIAALGPRFSPCFSAGTTLKMTKPSLRAMLAEALYRMSARQLSRGVAN